MPDQNLNCVDCGSSFIYSERDQQHFTKLGFAPPKRCQPCRALKKQNRERQDQQRG